jgi:transcriptional regulator with XRE-family HTH domain
MDQLTSVIETSPDPVDRHVGLKIRMRRHELRVSQERLAEAIGLSFQQLQKYENAANRVSCSKLWQIAGFLAVPPGFFFEGLDEPAASPANWASEFLSLPEGLDIAETFPRIKTAHVRRHIAGLVRSLAYAEAGRAANHAWGTQGQEPEPGEPPPPPTLDSKS